MATILDLPEMRERVYRWTVKDYEKLEDDPAFKRAELIRGIIVNKMAKSPLHEFLTLRIYEFFRQVLIVGLFVRQEASLRLEDSVPEPDVAVIRGAPEDFRLRHPTTAELVVEIAVSSITPDRENASMYAEAGVEEYWIVLGEIEQIEVYRRPVNGAYRDRRIYERSETIEGVEVIGGSFAVEALFA